MRIIGGTARGRKLATFRGRAIRPALARIRESIFSHLGACVEQSIVLDLYAGCGAYGLEALSRGARQAIFVDSSPAALQVIETNISNLGFTRQARTLCGDALIVPSAEETEKEPADLIFMDPPFDLFGSPHRGQEIIRRATDLLRARSTRQGARLILRFPAFARREIALERAELRRYGESMVAFLEKGI
ncbi:MAG: RsmD family RNA methyltransferase [Planctomycetes bacterium]|nr:RsmD family RNA methyltransferase [Planctomycetota bacterium]